MLTVRDGRGVGGGGVRGVGQYFYFIIMLFLLTGMQGAWGGGGGGGGRERERGQCSAEKFQNRGEKSGDIVKKNGGTVIWQLKISFPSFLSIL